MFFRARYCLRLAVPVVCCNIHTNAVSKNDRDDLFLYRHLDYSFEIVSFFSQKEIVSKCATVSRGPYIVFHQECSA